MSSLNMPSYLILSLEDLPGKYPRWFAFITMFAVANDLEKHLKQMEPPEKVDEDLVLAASLDKDYQLKRKTWKTWKTWKMGEAKLKFFILSSVDEKLAPKLGKLGRPLHMMDWMNKTYKEAVMETQRRSKGRRGWEANSEADSEAQRGPEAHHGSEAQRDSDAQRRSEGQPEAEEGQCGLFAHRGADGQRDSPESDWEL